MKTEKGQKRMLDGKGAPALPGVLKNALSITAVYLALGCLWILLSGVLLEFFVRDRKLLFVMETAKGWTYVLITSALLFVLISRALRRERRVSEEARALNREMERSNTLFAAILEGSPEIGVFVLDTRCRYLVFNRRHSEIMRGLCGREIAAGMDLLELLRGTGKEEMAEICLRRALAGEAFSDDEITAGGQAEKRYWRLYFSPVRPGEGEVAGVTCFMLDVTSRKLAERESRYLGYHDKLTGLYNRRFYEKALHRIDRTEHRPVSVILGDVNGLKLVNDTFGHEAGDELLQLAAGIIASLCRPGDILARWGGDEFIILLPGTDAAQAEEMTARATELCAQLRVRSLRTDVSFGTATRRQGCEKLSDVVRKAEDSMYRRKMTESKSMRSRTVDAIMRTLHEKNPREADHSVRVSDICRRIGRALGFTDAQVNTLYLVGYLHDIGKIALEEEILNKPGRLTDEEFDAVRRHPEIGWRILRSSYEVEEIADAILAHHERWDGKGYPKRLRGEEIPVYARIVAVADSYDAMTGVRTYRRSISPQQAAEEIARCAGKQFDPAVAQAFVGVVFKSLPASGAEEEAAAAAAQGIKDEDA